MTGAKKPRPTLGLAMIMKDEIDDLDRIVNDYRQYFDKIYVTVTHKKTYDTLLKNYPKGLTDTDKIELSYFKWIDHFGKARRHNQAQIKTDYWMWIDLDDEIDGAEKLRQVIEYMIAKDLEAVVFRYDRVQRTNLLEPARIQWRERIIKTDSGLEWNDAAVHENISIEGDTDMILSDVVVKHRKTAEQMLLSNKRNIVILEKEWKRAHHTETAQYIGAVYMDTGDYESAIEKILFVVEHSESEVERFRAWQRLSECYLQTGRYDLALAAAAECVAVDPSHPGPWYQQFAVYQAMGFRHTAMYCAEVFMSKQLEGRMAVLIGYDPSLYQYKGPFNIARYYLSIGNKERAYQVYSEVKKIAPEYIDQLSVTTGVLWDDEFERAYNESQNTLPALENTRLQELKLLVYEAAANGQPREGSADNVELNYLADLAKRPGVKRIAEIGFNAGMSSYAFLHGNTEATVTSFDLGEYDYGKLAKKIIDKDFPNRHQLILGDSLKTVPDYLNTNPDQKFDLIFIDGGHDYEIAKADLENMRQFATKETIVIIDDLTPWLPWGVGPYRAWTEALEKGIVIQDELVKDGKVVDEMRPPGSRSWARGRFVM